VALRIANQALQPVLDAPDLLLHSGQTDLRNLLVVVAEILEKQRCRTGARR